MRAAFPDHHIIVALVYQLATTGLIWDGEVLARIDVLDGSAESLIYIKLERLGASRVPSIFCHISSVIVCSTSIIFDRRRPRVVEGSMLRRVRAFLQELRYLVRSLSSR